MSDNGFVPDDFEPLTTRRQSGGDGPAEPSGPAGVLDTPGSCLGVPPSAPFSTSLDPLESKSHRPSIVDLASVTYPEDQRYLIPSAEFADTPATSELEATFRHSGWAARRQGIWSALLRSGASVNRLDSFAKCGSMTRVEYSLTADDFRAKGSYCHDRFCVPCAREKAARTMRALLAACADKTGLRFVTLTLRHRRAPLAEVLRRLRECFALLRRRKWWLEHVRGGVAILEVKLSKHGLWHPHLHIITEGKFMPQQELAAQWLAVTGDSSVVDVRAIDAGPNGAHQIGKYVTKYVTKPCSSDIESDPALLDEFILALKGQRQYDRFGTWRKVDLDADDPTSPNDWETVGGLDSLIDARPSDLTPLELRALAWIRARFASRASPSPEDSPPLDG